MHGGEDPSDQRVHVIIGEERHDGVRGPVAGLERSALDRLHERRLADPRRTGDRLPGALAATDDGEQPLLLPFTTHEQREREPL